MKICLINTLYDEYKVGGAEVSVRNLAETLYVLNNDVSVITLTSHNEGYKKVIKGVEVHHVPYKNIYWPYSKGTKSTFRKMIWHTVNTWNTFIVKDVFKILDLIKPDVVHTNNISGFSPLIWKTISSLKIPIIHTLRDYYLICPKNTMYKNGHECESQCLDCKVFSLNKKNLSKYVSKVVGISDFILNRHLKKGYFANSSEIVIHNSYDPPKQEILKTAICQKKIITFGFVGALKESKGIELLLQVFKNEEIVKGDNWRLLIAGNGDESYVNGLKESYASPYIEFLGYVDSTSFYNKIDVIIIPSLWNEPFGRVVIEGLAHKLLVLGSRRGGIPELLSNGSGLLFNPEIEELEGLILDILNHSKRYSVRNNGFKYEFSNNDIALKYLKLYNRVLK